MDQISPGLLGKSHASYILPLIGRFSGTQYLGIPPSSIVPLLFNRNARLKSGTFWVNQADSGRNFLVEILRDGAVVASLVLQAGDQEVGDSALSVDYVAGSKLSARAIGVTGAGQSQFHRGTLTLTFED